MRVDRSSSDSVNRVYLSPGPPTELPEESVLKFESMITFESTQHSKLSIFVNIELTSN